MGHNIFDWEDEDDAEKSAPQAEVFEQPYYVPQPGPQTEIFEQPLNSWETEQWNDPWEQPADEKQSWDTPAEYIEYQPESTAETVRRGGMAWSAGIVFFSSVAFMLLFGWVADYLLQISPWGIVGGIILGSIIGFIQFFRISSQIFNPSKTESALRPLLTRDDDDA